MRGTLATDFDPSYRALLQYLLLKKSAPLKSLATLLEGVSGEPSPDIHDAVRSINKNIEKFHQRIVVLPDELTGVETCCLVASRAEAKALRPRHQPLSVVQNEYLIRVVTRMIRSGLGFVGSIEALNMVSTLKHKRISRAAAEETLKLLVRKKLLVSSAGFYYMSPLLIADMEDVLHFSGAKVCFMCKKLVMYCAKCRTCDERFHLYCLNVFKEKTSGSNKCPSCRSCDILLPDNME